MAGGRQRRGLRRSRNNADSHAAERAVERYKMRLRRRDYDEIARHISANWRGPRGGRTNHSYEYKGKTLRLVFDWDIKRVVTVLPCERRELPEVAYADDLSDVARYVVAIMAIGRIRVIRVPCRLTEGDLAGIARQLGRAWRVAVEECRGGACITTWQSCARRDNRQQRQLIVTRRLDMANEELLCERLADIRHERGAHLLEPETYQYVN